jgi:hypothetical protein
MFNLAKLEKIQVSTLKNIFIFLPVIMYAPFFFSEVINPYIRIGYFFIISLYLFISNRKFYINDLIIAVLFIMLIILFYLSSSDIEGLISAGNYCLTIFFGWALHRYLQASNQRKYTMLNLYVGFFYLVAIFSTLSLIYLLLFGEFDLFGFKHEIRTHLVTPFGVHFKRIIYDGFFLYRSFFYFVEGAHASIFYAANIIIVAPLLKSGSSRFAKVNFLGGLLTFSMTFYAVLFILYGFKKTKSTLSFFGVALLAFTIFILFQSIDILSYSSSDDRTERFLLFFISMDIASISQILFGHGIAFDGGFVKAFNSGLTLSIYETGIIGTITQLLILYMLTRSSIILVFFLLSALVLDPIHYPLFWFLIVTASQIIRTKDLTTPNTNN